ASQKIVDALTNNVSAAVFEQVASLMVQDVVGRICPKEGYTDKEIREAQKFQKWFVEHTNTKSRKQETQEAEPA
ncbi:hypothetical protein ACSTK1_23630, partial [Vibrio parahaemolyticus]